MKKSIVLSILGFFPLIMFLSGFNIAQEIKCNLYPNISSSDKIDTLKDEEFGIGDDDINNITEPNVVIKADNGSSDKNEGKRLKDYNLRTSWIGRVNVKYQIDYTFDLSDLKDSKMDFNKIIIFNGNRYNIKKWKSYSRVKKLLMYVNGKPKCFLNLADTYKMQTFNINKVSVQGGNKVIFTFKILENYGKGGTGNIALSELKFE